MVQEQPAGQSHHEDDANRLRERVADLEAREKAGRMAADQGVDFRDILDNAHDAFFVYAPDGTIVYVNRAALILTDLAPDELLGMDIMDLVLPEEREDVAYRRARVAAGEIVPPYERKGRRPDGSPVFLEIRLSAVYGADGVPTFYYTVVRDVTARRQRQATVRKLLEAVEHSPASIVITNRDGDIEYVNQRFVEMTGYLPEEVLGHNPRILQSGQTPLEVHEHLWQTIVVGETWTGEFLNKKKDGTLFWEAASISPVTDDHGEITHFVAVKEDITARKSAEAEQERLILELDAYASTVAHDIQSPLQIIMGYSDLLINDEIETDADRRMAFTYIRDYSAKVSNIVNELLLLARLRSDEEIDLALFDTGVLIENARRRLANLLESRGVTIHAPAAWPGAVGHAPWVEEVWVNYLSNAAKYGGDPPIITLNGRIDEAGSARFEVTDNGNGLSPTEQEQLFRPFSRVGSRKVSGEGLGLSIVQRIVERLGGEVGVDSLPGEGSTFWFTLPAA